MHTPSSSFGQSGQLDHVDVCFNYTNQDLHWYEVENPFHEGCFYRENVVVVVPADDGEDGYHILMMDCGDDKPSYHEENEFAYRTNKYYATGLPLGFLQNYPMYFLPKHLFCLWTAPNESKLHIIVSVVDSPRANEFLKAVVQPTLEAIKFPSDTYSLHRITTDMPLREVVNNTIRPLAERGINQTILLVAGGQTLSELVNTLPAGENRTQSYMPPVVGVVALGPNNAFAHSLERKSFSTSLGMNAFVKGTPGPPSLLNIQFSGGWSWQSNTGLDLQTTSEPVYSFLSVLLGSQNSDILPQCEHKLIISPRGGKAEVVEIEQSIYTLAARPTSLEPGSGLSVEFGVGMGIGISGLDEADYIMVNGDKDINRLGDIERLRVEFQGQTGTGMVVVVVVDGRHIVCSKTSGWLEIEAVRAGQENVAVVMHQGIYDCSVQEETII